MVLPRFMFVERSNRQSTWVPAWPGAWGQSEDGQAAPANWTAWRLIGSNNRELGRSFYVYPDLDACRAGLELMRAGSDQFQSTLAIDPDTASWGWRLSLHGSAVAASSRPYRRQRECLYNLGKFVAALPLAVVHAPQRVEDAS